MSVRYRFQHLVDIEPLVFRHRPDTAQVCAHMESARYQPNLPISGRYIFRYQADVAANIFRYGACGVTAGSVTRLTSILPERQQHDLHSSIWLYYKAPDVPVNTMTAPSGIGRRKHITPFRVRLRVRIQLYGNLVITDR